MKRIMSAALPLAIAFAGSAGAQTAVAKFDVAGIPVIYKQVTANDVVAVRLYIRGGAASLTPANAGIESMMLTASTQGTSKYSRDAFAARSTDTGTNIGSVTTMDYSVLTMQGVRQNWDAAWDLFTEAAVHPTFPQAEVEIVRGQLLDAARRRTDDPDTYLGYLADSLFYAGHPYSVLTGGTVASLTAVTRDALAAWHKQRMTKENLLIVVVGNVPRADLTSRIQAAFSGLPATGGKAPVVKAVGTVTPELVVVEKALPTNYITGFYAAPALTDADYPAFRAATDMLADRLFQEVRTKRNMTYAVAAGLETRTANRGRLYVTAVDPDTTVKVIFWTVRQLQDSAVTAQEVAENVNASLTNYLLGQETNMGQAAALGLWEIGGGGWQNYNRFIESYRKVKPADIQRVAKQYMQHGRFVVIGDPKKVTRSVLLAF
ncbi:MAG: pitrilysin family protein [Gemmatimonadales bacterium]